MAKVGQGVVSKPVEAVWEESPLGSGIATGLSLSD